MSFAHNSGSIRKCWGGGRDWERESEEEEGKEKDDGGCGVVGRKRVDKNLRAEGVQRGKVGGTLIPTHFKVGEICVALLLSPSLLCFPHYKY